MSQETIAGKVEILPPEKPVRKFTMRELRKAVQESTTPEDVIEVMERLRKSSMNGSIKAAELWLSYALGRPTTMEPAETGKLDVLQIAIARLQKSED